jgi:hypothetical protein
MEIAIIAFLAVPAYGIYKFVVRPVLHLGGLYV